MFLAKAEPHKSIPLFVVGLLVSSAFVVTASESTLQSISSATADVVGFLNQGFVIPFATLLGGFLALSAASPATAASGVVAYVPITLTNNQASATPTGFQVLVIFNPSSYQSYESSNLGNIRFCADVDCTSPLYAWLESCTSSCSPSAPSADVWIRLNSAISGSQGTLAIYMGFLPTSTNFDCSFWGEAPQLSATYGQCDNGGSVFNFYDDFAGTVLSSKWSTADIGTTQINVKNGLSLTGPQAYGTGVYGGIITTAPLFSPQYFDSYVVSRTVCCGGIVFEESTTNTFPSTGGDRFENGYDLDSTSPSAANIEVASGAGVNSRVGSGTLSLSYPAVVSMAWLSTGSQAASGNYVQTILASDSSIGIGSYYLSIQDSGGSYSANATIDWTRARDVPPNNVMPAYSLGPVTSLSGVVSQPVNATFNNVNGGSPQTIAISGCAPYPSTFAGDGSSHSISMLASCTFTLSLPQGYQFTGGTGTLTCASGTCSPYGTTYEAELVTQPIAAAWNGLNGGPVDQVVTVSGCDASPSYFQGDGSVHDITMSPSCIFSLSLPSTNQFIVGGSGATTCAYGICPVYQTYYEALANSNSCSSSYCNIAFIGTGLPPSGNANALQFAIYLIEKSIPSSYFPNSTLNYLNNFDFIGALPAGNYEYSVYCAPSSVCYNYTPSPQTGQFSSPDESPIVISFSSAPPPRYTVTFTETGLPSGTSWSVVFPSWTSATSSSTSSIAFQNVANGIYGWSISGLPTGCYSSPSANSLLSLTVNGGNVNIPIAFTCSQLSQSVTQPIVATFNNVNGGSTQTVSVSSGCNPSPPNFPGNGVAQDITMNANCAFTLSLPSGYQFTGGTGTTTCSSATCPPYTTSYEAISATIPSVRISPATAAIDADGVTSATFTATPSGGSGTYTSYSWTVPSGLSASSGTCTSSGTTCAITSTSVGSYAVKVTVTDSNGATSSAQSASVTVNSLVSAVTLGPFKANPTNTNAEDSVEVTFSGGTSGYAIALTYGTSGSSCSADSTPGGSGSYPSSPAAVTFAVPSTPGTYFYCAMIIDSVRGTAVSSSPSAALTVNSASGLSAGTLSSSAGDAIDIGQGTAFSTTGASGGSGGYTYAWTNLPSGCTSSNSPSINCTPTGASSGSLTVTLTVTDSKGETAPATISVTVYADPTVSVSPQGPLSYELGQPVSSLTATVTYSGSNTVSVEWFGSSTSLCSALSTDTGISGLSFAPSTISTGTTFYCAAVSDAKVPNYSRTSNVVEVTVGTSLTNVILGSFATNPIGWDQPDSVGVSWSGGIGPFTATLYYSSSSASCTPADKSAGQPVSVPSSPATISFTAPSSAGTYYYCAKVTDSYSNTGISPASGRSLEVAATFSLNVLVANGASNAMYKEQFSANSNEFSQLSNSYSAPLLAQALYIAYYVNNPSQYPIYSVVILDSQNQRVPISTEGSLLEQTLLWGYIYGLDNAGGAGTGSWSELHNTFQPFFYNLNQNIWKQQAILFFLGHPDIVSGIVSGLTGTLGSAGATQVGSAVELVLTIAEGAADVQSTYGSQASEQMISVLQQNGFVSSANYNSFELTYNIMNNPSGFENLIGSLYQIAYGSSISGQERTDVDQILTEFANDAAIKSLAESVYLLSTSTTYEASFSTIFGETTETVSTSVGASVSATLVEGVKAGIVNGAALLVGYLLEQNIPSLLQTEIDIEPVVLTVLDQERSSLSQLVSSDGTTANLNAAVNAETTTGLVAGLGYDWFSSDYTMTQENFVYNFAMQASASQEEQQDQLWMNAMNSDLSGMATLVLGLHSMASSLATQSDPSGLEVTFVVPPLTHSPVLESFPGNNILSFDVGMTNANVTMYAAGKAVMLRGGNFSSAFPYAFFLETSNTTRLVTFGSPLGLYSFSSTQESVLILRQLNQTLPSPIGTRSLSPGVVQSWSLSIGTGSRASMGAVGYAVSFVAVGPSSAPIVVSLDGQLFPLRSGNLTFSGLPPGNYSYEVLTGQGYSASPASGSFLLNGNITVQIKVNQLPEFPYLLAAVALLMALVAGSYLLIRWKRHGQSQSYSKSARIINYRLLLRWHWYR